MRLTTGLTVTGAGLLLSAGLWSYLAPSQLQRFPTRLDRTATVAGTLTLQALPATLTPLGPISIPLTVDRHLHVLTASGDRVVVADDATQHVGRTQQRSRQVYVIDRDSRTNVIDSRAVEYDLPLARTGRAGSYSLAIHPGATNFSYWKNEISSSYPLRRIEQRHLNGLDLDSFAGHVQHVVGPGYLRELSRQGFPRTLPTHSFPTIADALPAVTHQLIPADAAALTDALAVPTSLTYTIRGSSKVLVEPDTGAIVGIDHLDQTVLAAPTVPSAAVHELTTLLRRPAYNAHSQTRVGLSELLADLTHPQGTPVLTTVYAQTPPSLAAAVATVAVFRGQVRTVRVIVPSAVTVAAGTMLLAAFLRSWRRRHKPDLNPGSLRVTNATAGGPERAGAVDVTGAPDHA